MSVLQGFRWFHNRREGHLMRNVRHHRGCARVARLNDGSWAWRTMFDPGWDLPHSEVWIRAEGTCPTRRQAMAAATRALLAQLRASSPPAGARAGAALGIFADYCARGLFGVDP